MQTILTLYTGFFIIINVSLLAPHIQEEFLQQEAIRNLLIFATWLLTMYFTVQFEKRVSEEHISWVIALYSYCILTLLIVNTLFIWGTFHKLI